MADASFQEISANSDSEDELPLVEVARRHRLEDSDEEDDVPLAQVFRRQEDPEEDLPPPPPPDLYLPLAVRNRNQGQWLGTLNSCYRHSEWLGEFMQVTGPKAIFEDKTEFEIYTGLLQDNIIEDMVVETNRYAQQFLASHPNLPPCSRARKWSDTDVSEMKAFLGILLMMGYIKCPSYESYWNTDPLTELPGLRKIMSRDRWLLIWEFLHLVDNNNAPPHDTPMYDKLYKIRPFLDKIVPKWTESYVASRNVSVDESMIAYKGRTPGMTQYMPAKPHKWGIKAWVLSEAKTGYMCNFSIYRGAEVHDGAGGVTERVVMNICRPLYHKRYHLYMDNYFTSPSLFESLSDVSIGACGTLRANRTGVPQQIKDANLAKGDPAITVRVGNYQFITWQDKKQVNLLTTLHNTETCIKKVRCKDPATNFVKEVVKPKAVECYNQFMSGVDLVDQKIITYLSVHRTLKWWKKIFVYLLEATFVNSCIIWQTLHPGERFYVNKFRVAVIRGFVEGYERSCPNPGRRYSQLEPLNRLTERHFPAKNPRTTPSGKPARPDCAVCSVRKTPKGRRQTQFICKQCDVPLHPDECMELYHTNAQYRAGHARRHGKEN